MHQASALQIATLAWVITCAVGGPYDKDNEPMISFIGKRLGGLLLAISFLVCLYKCCCGDDSDAKTSEDAEQPPASTQDGGQESNQLHRPNKPTVPSYNTCPPSPTPPSYESPGFSKVVVHMKKVGPPQNLTVYNGVTPRSPGPRSPGNVAGASSPYQNPPRSPRIPGNVIGASSPFRQGPDLDDGPRFEPKELQNVQLPLSSDSPIPHVYTSKKLNFL